MSDRMTAAEWNQTRPKAKRRDIEGPIHKGILEYVQLLLPSAVIHHSPNEVDMAGKEVAKAIAKARFLGTRKGWPDLEFILDGRAYFLEVKVPGNGLSEDQAQVFDELRLQGCKCALVSSLQDVYKALVLWGLI